MYNTNTEICEKDNISSNMSYWCGIINGINLDNNDTSFDPLLLTTVPDEIDKQHVLLGKYNCVVFENDNKIDIYQNNRYFWDASNVFSTANRRTRLGEIISDCNLPLQLDIKDVFKKTLLIAEEVKFLKKLRELDTEETKFEALEYLYDKIDFFLEKD